MSVFETSQFYWVELFSYSVNLCNLDLKDYLFFSFICISWRLITLQYCSGFCHTLTWISHGFTCIPENFIPNLARVPVIFPPEFIQVNPRATKPLLVKSSSFYGQRSSDSVVKNPPANAGDEDVGSIPGSGRSSGGGRGNPLQYSCLENPMDRGAWRAAVHGVPKSWTRLSNWAWANAWRVHSSHR